MVMEDVAIKVSDSGRTTGAPARAAGGTGRKARQGTLTSRSAMLIPHPAADPTRQVPVSASRVLERTMALRWERVARTWAPSLDGSTARRPVPWWRRAGAPVASLKQISVQLQGGPHAASIISDADT